MTKARLKPSTTKSSFPKVLSLNYIVHPVYDLSVSLIVANVCQDGILVTSDRLATGTVVETGETIINNSMQKTFAIKDLAVYGFAGHGVESPEFMDKIIQGKLKADMPVDQLVGTILDIIQEHHTMVKFNGTVWLLVAGFDGDIPVIYTGGIKENVRFIDGPKDYAAVGEPPEADKALSATKILPSKRMLQKHKEVFRKTARKRPRSVGTILNSWIITKELVRSL